MPRYWWPKLIASILVVFCVAPIMMPGLNSWLPLSVHLQGDRGYVVQPPGDAPLGEGLQAGDVLDLPRMSPAARVAVIEVGNLPRGASYLLYLRRGTQPVQVRVTVTAEPASPQNTLNRWLGAAMLSLGALLGLLTLWRGRDAAAWGLTLFALGLIVRFGLTAWPLPAMPVFWLGQLGNLIQFLALAGLYVVAEHLVGPGLSSRELRRWRRFVVGLMVYCIVTHLAWDVTMIYAGWVGSRWMENLLLTLPVEVLLGVPAVLLLRGYRSAPSGNQLRIRWVLWSTVLLLATVLAFGFASPGNFYLLTVLQVLQGLSFTGYLYAVLRARLVDVSFVVDRALAYAFTTTLFVGVFALVENYLEQHAVGPGASLLLQIVATLGLALSFNRLHQRVEKAVERVFFAAQQHRVEQLARLSRECGFVEHYEKLPRMTVARVQELLKGSGAALYERFGGNYRLLAAVTREFPETVDLDDNAFVALRAHSDDVDLRQAHSALGADGWAFAMTVRGQVVGALVCGERPNERFSPEERQVLGELARELGAALYVLRGREHERFIAAIAAGALDDLQVRTQARALTATGPG